MYVAQIYTFGAVKYADRNWEKGLAILKGLCRRSAAFAGVLVSAGQGCRVWAFSPGTRGLGALDAAFLSDPWLALMPNLTIDPLTPPRSIHSFQTRYGK